MGVVSGSIKIRDNMSAVLRSISSEQRKFQRDVKKTKAEMKSAWDKKYHPDVDTSSVTKKMRALRKQFAPLQKKLVKVVAIKDMVTGKLKSINSKLKLIGSKVTAPLVKIKDAASAGISKIAGKLKSIAKSVVIPVTVAGAVAVGGVAAAAKSGMQLEQQQISMEHFIGATNKGMDEPAVKKVAAEFTSALRENANVTPFETGEVIGAGSRAIAIANGSTVEAMRLVTLAEDMAAASGGTKSISDAIEALADAKLGEMERLKEFGFKVSAEEFDKKGFEGVSADLGDFYGGAAAKLASSGAGLMSTITGKLKSSFSDFGLSVVEKLKPSFSSIIGLIDKSAPFIERFGGVIADGIGKGIDKVGAVLPTLISGLSALKPIVTAVTDALTALQPSFTTTWSSIGSSMGSVMKAAIPIITSIIQTVQAVLPTILPVISTVFTTIGSILTTAAPLIQGVVQGIGTAISTLAPVFNTIFGGIGEKVGSVISFIGERMGFITELINWAAPMISDILSTAWTVISPVLDVAISVFELIFSVVQRVFPGVKKVIETVWNVIKPIVETVGKVLGGIGSAIGWLADLVGGKSKKSDLEVDDTPVGNNAKGTNNWRGGVTWVGEKGPELLDLPRGSRILPNKESVRYAGAMSGGYGAPPKATVTSTVQKMAHSITVTIAKLADTIIVREDADIDAIGEKVAKEIVAATRDLVPV